MNRFLDNCLSSGHILIGFGSFSPTGAEFQLQQLKAALVPSLRGFQRHGCGFGSNDNSDLTRHFDQLNMDVVALNMFIVSAAELGRSHPFGIAFEPYASSRRLFR